MNTYRNISSYELIEISTYQSHFINDMYMLDN